MCSRCSKLNLPGARTCRRVTLSHLTSLHSRLSFGFAFPQRNGCHCLVRRRCVFPMKREENSANEKKFALDSLSLSSKRQFNRFVPVTSEDWISRIGLILSVWTWRICRKNRHASEPHSRQFAAVPSPVIRSTAWMLSHSINGKCQF